MERALPSGWRVGTSMKAIGATASSTAKGGASILTNGI
eukprot:CAMPEP_0201281520 /NCGR_PEP_ID=MMETSP1317-20130820/3097_1 /ASSEMBLY_ACC=CAM_ASM_000770 /TAXON_ID=187299 /ORGANISM="Undescribed Undescribed, Strain Undescribed" /LENGTH=37 /DNA_ID= /DNA_START= /DNA_END= /DNA_ORIENTATION=